MRPYTRSFAGGEIADELFGRLDLAKNQTGLAECRNFEVLPAGPVRNRAGWQYVNRVKDITKATRLVDFAFSTTQTFHIELGDQYIRWHTNGGALLEATTAITAITQANPGVVTDNAHGYTNGQWVFLAGIAGMTQLNGRFVKVANATANTFELKDLDGTNINTTGYVAYSSGGTAARVYEIASPYLEADLFDLHVTQKNDVVSIAHPNYDIQELKRLGATNWTLTAPTFQSNITVPNMPTVMNGTALDQSANNSTVNLGAAVTAPAQMYHYVVTSVDKATLEESPALIELVGTGNPTGTQISTMYNISAATSANPAVFTAVFVPGTPDGELVWITGASGPWAVLNGRSWKFTFIGQTFKLSDPVTGIYFDSTGFAAYAGGATAGTLGLLSNLNAAGQFHNIRATGPATTRHFNVYKKLNGIYGYIGQLGTGQFDYLRDNNITPDMGRTLAINDGNPFSGAGNRPGEVGYFEGRRGFAGTDNKPATVMLARSGSESNMTYSIPSRDDDAITLPILSKDVQRIRHIVPLDTLLLLGNSGEWKVAPQNSDILTPDSAFPKQISAEGASNVQPVISGASVIYASDQGGHVREIKYKNDGNFIANYFSTDISVLAPHLFDGYTIKQFAYTKAPNKTVWAVRSDGVLLGLTYLPEHEIVAWHKHDTAGTFESVSAAREGNETALYAVVRRNINGQNVRHIERKHTRVFATLADCFFVDAGATYSGAPVTTITNGLWHLEGKTVSILADGAVLPQKVVTNGSIALEVAASVVHVGLPYTADLKTLPLASEVAAAFGQSQDKNLNRVWMRVKDASSIKAGPDFDHLREYKQRTNEPYGSPPRLKNGRIEIGLDPAWAEDGALCIRQDQPLPLTLVSMALDASLGG